MRIRRMDMSTSEYHYTESGLDSVYLVNGYELVEGKNGASLIIQDIDGLHNAIGRLLVTEQKRLSGKDIRFLRTELLLSQAVLAQLLQVDEQTVARWEKGKTKIPGTADATLRLLYLEHIGGNEKISDLLRRIADIDDDMDRRLTLEESDTGWDIAA
jgi:DNA-binding transcriptional regulator YiaG